MGDCGTGHKAKDSTSSPCWCCIQNTHFDFMTTWNDVMSQTGSCEGVGCSPNSGARDAEMEGEDI